MPLTYDDEPGSWGRKSEGWPETRIPVELVELYVPYHTYPDISARKLILDAVGEAKIPYGCYVSVGDLTVRFETPEQRALFARAAQLLVARLPEVKRAVERKHKGGYTVPEQYRKRY